MLKVGLTGGIGCGKTTVAKLFMSHGISVLDADCLARELVEPGQPALDRIIQHFGKNLLKEGRLDRAQLRSLIFADPEAKKWLESLLHPLIYRSLELRTTPFSAPYCLWVVPLLLETEGKKRVDRLLVVDCPESLQRQRVTQRDGVSDSEISRILASQVSRSERLKAADDIIDNTVSLDVLTAQVERLHRHYLMLGA
jgi:dephospho-CoA kinase